MDKTIIWHMKCDCRIWPIVAGNQIGKCGYCQQTPHTHCTEEEVEEYYRSRDEE